MTVSTGREKDRVPGSWVGHGPHRKVLKGQSVPIIGPLGSWGVVPTSTEVGRRDQILVTDHTTFPVEIYGSVDGFPHTTNPNHCVDSGHYPSREGTV